jgi:hypothetical protein
MRSIVVWGAVLMAACATEPVQKSAAQEAHVGKPSAPVQLDVRSVALGDQRFEVQLTATPTSDVDDVFVRLLLPEGVRAEEQDPAHFGRTSKGTARRFTYHVRLSVPGADIVGDARVTSGASTRNRAQIVRLGADKAAEAPQRTTTIVLPSGERVEEVRQ